MSMNIAAIQRWWSEQKGGLAWTLRMPPHRGSKPKDIGGSTDLLDGEAGSGGGCAQELPHLLQALQLDPGELSGSDPTAMRSMQLTCSACRSAPACRADLCNGISQKRYFLYCPNAPTIDALSARHGHIGKPHEP